MNIIYDILGEFALPKNQWKPVPKSELDSYDDEILSLIQTAYAPIGGHPNYNSSQDIHSQNAEYEVIDIDHDDKIDAVSVHKKKQGNKKFTATGHDNSKPAKSELIRHKVKQLKPTGYYIEVSGKIKDILLAKGVSPITDEDLVRKMLKGKEIEWNGDGTYQRDIAGKSYTKLMLGKPKMNENKNIMKKSQLKKQIREEILESIREGGWGEDGVDSHMIGDSIFTELEELEQGQTLHVKIKSLGDDKWDLTFNIHETTNEDTVGAAVGDFSDENPIIKTIDKGVNAIGKGLNKFAKKMEPLGKAAASATRRE